MRLKTSRINLQLLAIGFCLKIQLQAFEGVHWFQIFSSALIFKYGLIKRAKYARLIFLKLVRCEIYNISLIQVFSIYHSRLSAGYLPMPSIAIKRMNIAKSYHFDVCYECHDVIFRVNYRLFYFKQK